ncbi:50S ribosomal protein L25/general stress protein Ctc [Acinetobacter sp. HY1485]|uniref:50S ribosomal protein L25/general stress protein Ctc n=1 Tax=Acinetobacter sp. HY1485 TaxID=2970918 RepID=UPI0022B9A95B|nr:50S ribosomal protein L25/general stress protein Ctc [Acinetobacter sp. HY1485]
MSNFVLTAQARAEEKQGKGASRRLRHAAQVPAIIYGGDVAPVSITLELRELVKALESQAFFSSIVEINVDGQVQEVVIKALQRHPSKNLPMHADFQRVVRGEELTKEVPVNFINLATAKGVKAGGVADIHMNAVEIEVLPRNLPEAIEVDVANLDVNEAIRLADLVLPTGVKLTAEDLEQPVITVSYVKEDAADEEASEEAGE